MKGTKQRILRAARLLFNQYGVANVSQRSISNHIAISPGNLTYHFNKREEIVDLLYEELSNEIRIILEGITISEATFQVLYDMNKAINKVLFDNRFFIVDFSQLTRTNENMRKDYAELNRSRELILRNIIDQFITKGWFRKEEISGEYAHLITRFQVVNDYWLLAVGTTNEELMLKHTREFTEILMQSLYPYLTVQGQPLFRKVMKY